jgi:hypothetical protein
MEVKRNLATCDDTAASETYCHVKQEGPTITWAMFDIVIDLNYQNCIIEDSSSNCNPTYTETDYKFNFKLKLSDPYAKNVQGLVVMVNGIVLGNSAVPLNGLSFGNHTLALQVGRVDRSTASFEDINLVLISACENGLNSADKLCIIGESPSDPGESLDGSTEAPTVAPTFAPTKASQNKIIAPTPNRLGCTSAISRKAAFSIAWAPPQQRRRNTPLDLSEDIPSHPAVTKTLGRMQQQMQQMQLQTQQMQQMQQGVGLVAVVSSIGLVAVVSFIAFSPPRTTPAAKPAEHESVRRYSESEMLPLVGHETRRTVPYG